MRQTTTSIFLCAMLSLSAIPLFTGISMPDTAPDDGVVEAEDMTAADGYPNENVNPDVYHEGTPSSEIGGPRWLSIEWDWAVESTARGGKIYDRLTLTPGGIEPGAFGQEVPFYQHTIRAPGEIVVITVELGGAAEAPAEPAPALVPQFIGVEGEFVDPRWDGPPVQGIPADWELHHLSSDGDGESYSLRIHPVEYPSDGRPVVHTEAVVTYTWSPDVSSKTGTRGDDPTGPTKYLIITHDDMKEAVMPLAMWKSQKGLFAEVATTSEIEKAYPAGDLQTKMRQYVMDAEKEYDLQYLFLVGDWEKVPARNTRNSYQASMMGEPATFATDLYFACADQGTSWNGDGDADYAEEGELDDVIPDMAVGRLAVDDATTLTQMMAHLMSREKEPSWDANMDVGVLVAGDPGMIPGDPAATLEHFWDTYADAYFTGVESLYHDASGTLDFSSEDFKRVIDDGEQVLSYLGHGTCDEIPELFGNTDVSSLASNGSDGLFFAMACLTGWFDDPNQGSQGAVTNCFAETITETPGKGLAGYIGSSRMAVGSIDTTYSADAIGLEEDFWRSVGLVRGGLLNGTVGEVWRESISHFAESFHPFTSSMGDNPGLRTYLEYNLLGEPDQPLFFDVPQILDLDFTVAQDRTWVEAVVTNVTGDPVEGATVALFEWGVLGRSALTDAEGRVNITIPACNGGRINITASRIGDRPVNDSFLMSDNRPPKGVMSLDPPEPDGLNGYYVTVPTITLEGDEPVTVQCFWDNDEPDQYEPPHELTALEGNHTLNYKVTDKVGLSSSWNSMDILVDTRPPEPTLETDPAEPDGLDGWFVTAPEVTVGSDEKVIDITYWHDGDEEMIDLYNGPFQLLEGYHNLTFSARDIAGNNNTVSARLKVDLTAPVSELQVSHTPDGLNGYYVNAPRVKVSPASGGSASAERRWDDKGWTNATDWFDAPEGLHTLYHRARDTAGNYGAEGSETFKVDTMAPTLDVNITPSKPDGLKGYYITKPLVNLTSSDGDIYYCLEEEGGKPDWVAESRFFQDAFTVSDGRWELYARAVDKAGNRAEVDPLMINVNTTLPDLGWELDPEDPDGSGGWYDSEPELEMSSCDLETELSWRYAGGAQWYVYSGPVKLENGVFALEFRAQSPHGTLIEDSSGEIRVDTTGPEVRFTSPVDGQVFGPDGVTVRWNGSDGLSGPGGYDYRVGGGPWISAGMESSVTLSDLGNGDNTFIVSLSDRAGNKAAATLILSIDARAPRVVSAHPEGVDIPLGETIDITFSEPMDHDSVVIEVAGVEGSVTWDGETAVFTPEGRLPSGGELLVTVSGSDVCGNPMEPHDWSFTTEDVLGPGDDGPDGTDGPADGGSGSPVAIMAVLAIILALSAAVAGAFIHSRRRRAGPARRGSGPGRRRGGAVGQRDRPRWQRARPGRHKERPGPRKDDPWPGGEHSRRRVSERGEQYEWEDGGDEGGLEEF